MGRKPLQRGTKGGAAARAEPAARTEFNRHAARALDILSAFNAGEQFLGNADIAERTGIPKATVSRITATLTELGYLNHWPQLGKYETGPRVLALCYPLMSRLQVHVLARPLMDALARESNTTVGLSILDGQNVVFLESAPGERPHARRPMVGYRVPVAFTAMGWSCLAAMNVSERTTMLARIAADHPQQADEIARNVQQAIRDIWERGFCMSVGTLEAGANAVGVPYLHPDGRHIMAFNMTAPRQVLTRKSMETTWGPRLAAMVHALSQAGSGPLPEVPPSR